MRCCRLEQRGSRTVGFRNRQKSGVWKQAFEVSSAEVFSSPSARCVSLAQIDHTSCW